MPVNKSMVGFGLGTPRFEPVKLQASVVNVFCPNHEPGGFWTLNLGAQGGDLRSI